MVSDRLIERFNQDTKFEVCAATCLNTIEDANTREYAALVVADLKIRKGGPIKHAESREIKYGDVWFHECLEDCLYKTMVVMDDGWGKWAYMGWKGERRRKKGIFRKWEPIGRDD